MAKMSREKGKRGERELFGLLSDLLGFVVKRNINARRGDCDGLEVPGWACEVKRVERWENGFWTQALDQAAAVNRKPVLFFRANMRPWVAMIDLADVMPGAPRGHRVEMSLEAFALVAREQLNAITAHAMLSMPGLTPVITPLIRPTAPDTARMD